MEKTVPGTVKSQNVCKVYDNKKCINTLNRASIEIQSNEFNFIIKHYKGNIK